MQITANLSNQRFNTKATIIDERGMIMSFVFKSVDISNDSKPHNCYYTKGMMCTHIKLYVFL